MARRGRAARAAQPAHDARRAAVALEHGRRSRRSSTTACSPSASSSRATRCSSSSTRSKLNIEAETAASIARDDDPARPRCATATMLDDAAAPARGAWSARSTGSIEELVVERSRSSRRPTSTRTRSRASTHAKYMRDTVIPAMEARPRGRRPAREDRRRRPLAAAEVLGDAVHQVVAAGSADPGAGSRRGRTRPSTGPHAQRLRVGSRRPPQGGGFVAKRGGRYDRSGREPVVRGRSLLSSFGPIRRRADDQRLPVVCAITTIQGGIAAAAAGDTVAGRGGYVQRGPGAREQAADARAPASGSRSSTAAPRPAHDGMVRVDTTAGDVKIDGFTIRNAGGTAGVGSPCSSRASARSTRPHLLEQPHRGPQRQRLRLRLRPRRDGPQVPQQRGHRHRASTRS